MAAILPEGSPRGPPELPWPFPTERQHHADDWQHDPRHRRHQRHRPRARRGFPEL